MRQLLCIVMTVLMLASQIGIPDLEENCCNDAVLAQGNAYTLPISTDCSRPCCADAPEACPKLFLGHNCCSRHLGNIQGTFIDASVNQYDNCPKARQPLGFLLNQITGRALVTLPTLTDFMVLDDRAVSYYTNLGHSIPILDQCQNLRL
jgi:hypothetical protein